MRYDVVSLGGRRLDHSWRSWRKASLAQLLAALVLFFAFPGSGAGQQQELQQMAAERGTVRVLVQIRPEQRFVPEGVLSGAAVVAQRQGIRRARERVLARAAAFGATGVKRFERIPFVAMEIDAAGLNDLLTNQDVVSLEVDTPLRLLETTDPAGAGISSEDEPSLPALDESTIAIGADQAWADGYTGLGQAVAVLDTGVETSHSFLTGKVVSEACYSTTFSGYSSSTLCPGGVESSTSPGSGINCDPSIPSCDHGTHVAGIAVGTGSNFSGVGRDANLIAIQVFSRFDDPNFCGSSNPCLASWSSDQILALERVLELSATIDIASVNMSLGGGRYTSSSACDSDNAATKAAIDNLRSVGIATVIAAGNNGFADALSAPGCISTAVSVGSVSKSDVISWFSNEAPFLSLYAPGQAILSSVLFDGFGYKSGTSMAAPHVAGAWAILKQKSPSGSVDELLNTFQESGVPITSENGSWTTPRIALDSIGGDGPLDPHMAIGDPAWGSSLTWPFHISGWAIDAGAAQGTGVDAVHVWAFPSGSENDFSRGTFLGAATLGINRPGVASLYGVQFEPSGFQLDSTKILLPGGYTFKVFGRSTRTGVFDIVRTVSVNVQPVTRISVGSPANGDTVGSPFSVSGWAFNTGVPGGVGIDAVHVWALPASGPSVFLGSATSGISRPDVVAAFGVDDFEMSGFQLNVNTPLASGAYTLRVYASNTINGAFDTFVDRAVTLGSDPKMAIGKPAAGSVLSTPLVVSGWAVDLAASSGTGVDAVHVWAFPTSGAPATFLGAAALGLSRPDVAAFFGDPELEPSGFQLTASTPLTSGAYTLRVYARSSVTGTFNNSRAQSVIMP